MARIALIMAVAKFIAHQPQRRAGLLQIFARFVDAFCLGFTRVGEVAKNPLDLFAGNAPDAVIELLTLFEFVGHIILSLAKSAMAGHLAVVR